MGAGMPVSLAQPPDITGPSARSNQRSKRVRLGYHISRYVNWPSKFLDRKRCPSPTLGGA